MWWTELDESIWEANRRFLDSELDQLPHPIAKCAALYHGAPLTGLKGEHKRRAALQQKGWFSFWSRQQDHWLDLLSGAIVPTAGPNFPQIALARALPGADDWQLYSTSSERLSKTEVQPLIRRFRQAHDSPKGAGTLEVLKVWANRRALCLEPLERYKVYFKPSKKGRALEKFLALLESPAQVESDYLVFEVHTYGQEHLDDHPLMLRAESLGEVDSRWLGLAPACLQPSRVTEDLLIRSEGSTLRFPATLSFLSLHRALSCLEGSPESDDYFEFRLSLAREVTPEEDVLPEEEPFQVAATQKIGKHLQPDSCLTWNGRPLQALGTSPEEGPSPWFLDGPQEANLRLRRAFHSRLGKVLLETPKPPVGPVRPGLNDLKVKEAMVVCLLESAGPLTLDEMASYLQGQGFPLIHGEKSLKKAWRRAPIMEQDDHGQIHLVPGAVLMDRSLLEKLGPICGGEEVLTSRLESLLGRNDLWEKIYRAKDQHRVTLYRRDREPQTLLKPWMTAHGTRTNLLMINSESNWLSVPLDQVLDLQIHPPEP